jgi:hypothetical protein
MRRRKSMHRQVAETAFALAVTGIAGKWAVSYAGAQRGYEAAGGEYVFILLVYWAAYLLIQHVFDRILQDTGDDGKG